MSLDGQKATVLVGPAPSTLRQQTSARAHTGAKKASSLLGNLLLEVSVLGDLLVVLLERGEVLASLGELALLHALADKPVHKRALRVEQVKLVVEVRPRGRCAVENQLRS